MKQQVINGSPQEASTEVRSRTSTRREWRTAFETFNRYIGKVLSAMVDRDETAEKMRERSGAAMKARFDA